MAMPGPPWHHPRWKGQPGHLRIQPGGWVCAGQPAGGIEHAQMAGEEGERRSPRRRLLHEADRAPERRPRGRCAGRVAGRPVELGQKQGDAARAAVEFRSQCQRAHRVPGDQAVLDVLPAHPVALFPARVEPGLGAQPAANGRRAFQEVVSDALRCGHVDSSPLLRAGVGSLERTACSTPQVFHFVFQAEVKNRRIDEDPGAAHDVHAAEPLSPGAARVT